MNLPVNLRDAARADFDEAFDWYEQQRARRGVNFANRVQEALRRIGVMPEAHAVIYQDVRHARVSAYPYAIYYQVEPDQVVVIAVVHDKRDPKVWQSRV